MNDDDPPDEDAKDDDWFERSLSDLREEGNGADADADANADADADADVDADTEGADGNGPDPDSESEERTEFESEERTDRPGEGAGEGLAGTGNDRAERFPDGDPDDRPRNGPVGSDAGGDADLGGADTADPFDRDFSEALVDAPTPPDPDSPGSDLDEGRTGGGGPGAGPVGDPSGSASGPEGGGGFGLGATGDAGGFGNAGGGNAGSGENFGFGGDGADRSGFDEDEAEFESDIERISLGIEGLDEMILGGVPRRSLMAVIGSAGTGKTTFGLQFLHEALREDEKAVYITLEESREAILSTAEEKGWPFRRYREDEQLVVVPLDPVEMATSLATVRNDLPRLIDEFGAERLVLDSVSLLEMMYDHPAERRSEVFDFARSLKEIGVTTMLTSEASEENPYASRYGIVEYLTDAVFVLQYVRPSDFRKTRLAVEIQKIRDANHSRETKPYEITNDGISVYRQANIF